MMTLIEKSMFAERKTLEFSIFESLLKGIEKPGMYIGHEFGIKSKSLDYILTHKNAVLAALIFPDTYEVGMSNLGLQILYKIVNENQDFSAERAFSPWPDFEASLRSRKVKYFSLENRIFLNSFDLIGFNAANEMLYTNILNIIDLAGLEVRHAGRKNIFPLICAGGSAVVNPWPLSNFMDFMLIGDGEEAILEIMAEIREFKYDACQKVPASESDKVKFKKELLKNLAKISGVFVPDFYRVIYKSNGSISEIASKEKNTAARKIKKTVFKGFDRSAGVSDPVIPNIRIVHDRLNIEIMRGCSRGCRFCQAGFIYRHVRQKKPGALTLLSREGIKNTGYGEISFTSLSSSDFRGLSELVDGIRLEPGSEKISISLPSLRLDSFSLDIARKISSVRKTGLTFAPEAGSQRLRDIIKKDIILPDLMQSVRIALMEGWHKIKLYFMIGLPGEEKEDVEEIINLTDRVIDVAKQILPKRSIGRLQINVSINAFNPKPFTPFQWAAQDSIKNLQKKINVINAGINTRYVRLNWTNPKKSSIECALSRGDSRVSDAIELAWKTGSKFDNWTDFFNYEIWMESFKKLGLDISFYTTRRIGEDEILPWDIIDMGVKKEFFLKEYRSALKLLNKDLKKDCDKL